MSEKEQDYALDVARAFKTGSASPADASTNGDCLITLYDMVSELTKSIAQARAELEAEKIKVSQQLDLIQEQGAKINALRSRAEEAEAKLAEKPYWSDEAMHLKVRVPQLETQAADLQAKLAAAHGEIERLETRCAAYNIGLDGDTPQPLKVAESQAAELRRALAESAATVSTVINLLTKDRPACPTDLSESGRYELVIETAVELLRGLSLPALSQAAELRRIVSIVPSLRELIHGHPDGSATGPAFCAKGVQGQCAICALADQAIEALTSLPASVQARIERWEAVENAVEKTSIVIKRIEEGIVPTPGETEYFQGNIVFLDEVHDLANAIDALARLAALDSAQKEKANG